MRSQSLPKRSIKRIEQAEVAYPSVRYFQIHFEFLHEQFQKTLQLLESLQVQMSQMEQQISDCTVTAMSLQNDLINNKKSLSKLPHEVEKQAQER